MVSFCRRSLLFEQVETTQWPDSNLLNFKKADTVQSDYDVLARDQCNNNALIVNYLRQVHGANRLKTRHRCWSMKAYSFAFVRHSQLVCVCVFSSIL